MFIKLTNGEPEIYTIGKLRRDNPNVSFPKNISSDILSEYDVYSLTIEPEPEYNVNFQTATVGEIENINGVWTQGWVVTNKPIAVIRNIAVLPRSSFVKNLYMAGILDVEESISAGKGDWPSSFESVTQSMDEVDSAKSKILWASAYEIQRRDPLFDMLIDSGLVSEELVDQVFEIDQYI